MRFVLLFSCVPAPPPRLCLLRAGIELGFVPNPVLSIESRAALGPGEWGGWGGLSKYLSNKQLTRQAA